MERRASPRPAFSFSFIVVEMSQDDPRDLARFVRAQEHVIEQAMAELRAGRKRTHWMWFVFPQIQSLGSSEEAQWFAIKNLDEAKAYLAHAVLGPRLRECTQLVLDIQGKSLEQIFGSPDDLKFRSCMTLFAHATGDNAIFLETLKKYSGGEFDRLTMERISAA
jgi:uncharacterized protein (DUF1810 family)